ncbi:hypothetical protein D3C85_1182770 [compost metagenome]
MSVQSISTPAARAMATRWMAWLVEPPVASRATIMLTIDFSLMTSAMRPWPERASSTARLAAAAVRASRRPVSGWTKAVEGMCRPAISIIIWLELAVP